VPARVVRGPDDPIVSQAWAETVADLLPAGRLVVTAAGAHTLIGQLVEVSLPFLKRRLPSAGRCRRSSRHMSGPVPASVLADPSRVGRPLYPKPELKGASRMPRVREVMTPDPATASPSMSVVEAAQEMIRKEKGPLPVVEGGRVVAMVTDRDIIARVVAAGQDPSALRVSDIATKDVVTIGPDQDVQEARRLLAQHQLDRLVVVEEGDRLVGIISEADLRRDEGPLA
jgi:CBS domain-containing protein